MKIVKQGWTWHILPMPYKEMVLYIAGSARNCYRSEQKSFEEEEKFIKNLIKRGHHSPLEHVNLSLKITTDRGVLAELTRHRLSSFSVESTRYVKYKEVTYVLPVWSSKYNLENNWKIICQKNEQDYLGMLLFGATPQEARQVLNMSLKTDIVMTSNIRQWRTVLKQRTAKDAHPQMIALMTSILDNFKKEFPVFFEDL